MWVQKYLKSIRTELRVAVDGALAVTNCAGPPIVSIDPLGMNRDGWLCTCNGDYTSRSEGGATVCMHQVQGKTVDLWIAPDPWTKSTGANFSCNGGRAPNPPGSGPLLKWRWNYYSTMRERCNMTAGSALATGACPP